MFNPWGLVIVGLGLVLLWEAWLGDPKHLWGAVVGGPGPGGDHPAPKDPLAGLPGYFPIPPGTPIQQG